MLPALHVLTERQVKSSVNTHDEEFEVQELALKIYCPLFFVLKKNKLLAVGEYESP